MSDEKYLGQALVNYKLKSACPGLVTWFSYRVKSQQGVQFR